MTKQKEPKGHSEEYFGDYRDYWYNFDFLELMAKRWNLSAATSLLDVGCGQCHWSGILSNFLNDGTKIVAVDNDDKWSNNSEDKITQLKNDSFDFSLQHSDVYSLPFSDNTFDIVTAQTLLIHLDDPKKALIEMKRVLKPGGVLISAEPNNITQSLIKDSVSVSETIDERIESIKYSLVYEMGKIKAGKGDNSLGDLIPEYFNQIELVNIKTYMSDKCNTVIPPYDTKEMQAMLKWVTDESEFKNDIDNEAQQYFDIYNGKYDELFEKTRSKQKVTFEINRDAIKNQEYYRAGAFLMYLVSGIKKSNTVNKS